jgi:hypothetical protein
VSLWSQLDSALGTAVNQAGADIGGSLNAVLSNLDIRLKTNLGPEFSLGGIAQPPQDPSLPPQPAGAPGLLDAFGVKVSARLIDANGNVLASIGTPPATNPLLVVLYVALLGGLLYFTARGVAATFRH